MVSSERVYIYPCVNAYTDYHLKPGDNLIHLFLYRPYFLNIFQNKKSSLVELGILLYNGVIKNQIWP